MPTASGIPGPYRLYFYSFDCSEPRHAHVQREHMTCKYWLAPVALAANDGFSAHELNRIARVVSDNRELLAEAWDEHCGE